MLKRDQTQTFKHYSAYYKNSFNGYGVCILVKSNLIHSQVQFQADLQAVAVCITINNKTYTVASVYVPPSETLNELAFDRMIESFSSLYLILGDVNGHSYLWGANQENERGKVVQHLIDSRNLILLNDSVHSRFSTYHQTSIPLKIPSDIWGVRKWLPDNYMWFYCVSNPCKWNIPVVWSHSHDLDRLSNSDETDVPIKFDDPHSMAQHIRSLYHGNLHAQFDVAVSKASQLEHSLCCVDQGNSSLLQGKVQKKFE